MNACNYTNCLCVSFLLALVAAGCPGKINVRLAPGGDPETPSFVLSEPIQIYSIVVGDVTESKLEEWREDPARGAVWTVRTKGDRLARVDRISYGAVPGSTFDQTVPPGPLRMGRRYRIFIEAVGGKGYLEF